MAAASWRVAFATFIRLQSTSLKSHIGRLCETVFQVDACWTLWIILIGQKTTTCCFIFLRGGAGGANVAQLFFSFFSLPSMYQLRRDNSLFFFMMFEHLRRGHEEDTCLIRPVSLRITSHSGEKLDGWSGFLDGFLHNLTQHWPIATRLNGQMNRSVRSRRHNVRGTHIKGDLQCPSCWFSLDMKIKRFPGPCGREMVPDVGNTPRAFQADLSRLSAWLTL